MAKKEITDQERIIAAGGDAMKQVIVNSTSPRLIRRNYKPMGFWLWSPAIMQPFATLMWALEDLALERHTDLGSHSQVTRVRAARLTDDSRVFLYPTDWNDPQGIEVQRSKGKATMNFYGFFADAHTLVETGYAERFSIERAGEDSPVGSALVFDRANPLERKPVKKTSKTTKTTV